MAARQVPPFTSKLSKTALVLVLLWLPVHVLGLPWLLYWLGMRDAVALNFWIYGIGTLFMLIVGFRFLRRDFDALAEHPFRILLQILVCYGAMLLMNMAASGILSLFIETVDNPNNEAVMDLVNNEYGMMSAAAIFLAPIVEEMIFRAGIFGSIRNKSRVLAYLASMLLFSLYHVWGYALTDPLSWLYLVQYLPAAYLLCRCYEYCDSIWGSIFLHMLINFVSLQALQLLESLL